MTQKRWIVLTILVLALSVNAGRAHDDTPTKTKPKSSISVAVGVRIPCLSQIPYLGRLFVNNAIPTVSVSKACASEETCPQTETCPIKTGCCVQQADTTVKAPCCESAACSEVKGGCCVTGKVASKSCCESCPASVSKPTCCCESAKPKCCCETKQVETSCCGKDCPCAKAKKCACEGCGSAKPRQVRVKIHSSLPTCPLVEEVMVAPQPVPSITIMAPQAAPVYPTIFEAVTTYPMPHPMPKVTPHPVPLPAVYPAPVSCAPAAPCLPPVQDLGFIQRMPSVSPMDFQARVVMGDAVKQAGCQSDSESCGKLELSGLGGCTLRCEKTEMTISGCGTVKFGVSGSMDKVQRVSTAASSGEQVTIQCKGFRAMADQISMSGQGQIMLRGNVKFEYSRDDQQARIQCEQARVDLTTGHMEVMGKSGR